MLFYRISLTPVMHPVSGDERQDDGNKNTFFYFNLHANEKNACMWEKILTQHFTHTNHTHKEREREKESAMTTMMAGFWCDMMTISCMQRKKEKIPRYMNLKCCWMFVAVPNAKHRSAKGAKTIYYIKLSKKLSSLVVTISFAVCHAMQNLNVNPWHEAKIE